ncbi:MULTISPECIES: spore germination protein [Bacillaceae]|uniref:Spore germination protein n=1 Tax=Metabacillus sediminis TaxID=3117746 RepID=A0ABZ2NP59_9BACI|nr:spore germination protein [Bacillus sp. SJS]
MVPTTINLFNLKIHSISCNGSVNIGETVHNSHTASSKSTGSNSSFGDFSPADSLMENIYIDPDQNDQSNIANLDEFIASQS